MFHTTNYFLNDVLSLVFNVSDVGTIITQMKTQLRESKTRLCPFLTSPVGVAAASCSSGHTLVTVAQLVAWEGLFTVRAKTEGAV